MIGETILHYRILSKLGQGGMGVVYKAEDTDLKREVAIKFLPRQIAASDEERERFKIEAQAAAALNHANIATIYSIEKTNDETFIVMEYIKGQELKDRIDAGPLPFDNALNIAIQIAQGLQIAHEAGVIHRDIKSSNIMLTDRGEVKIMDFGLAKRGGRTKLTKEGTTLGTVAYMSPEQTKGDNVDQRSDIFSVGVLLYEMLTGQLPFKGDYDQAVTYSILNEDPEPVTGLRSGIPMELERIVNKCLEKDRSDRYRHADEIIVDLRKLKKESETKEVLSRSGARPARERKAKPSYFISAIVFSSIAFLIIGYLVFNGGSGSDVIRLVNPRQLTARIGVEAYPTWSPDGGRLAYAAWSQGASANIWVVQLGGGQAVNRTEAYSGLVNFPSWSPDGDQIAFWSANDGGGYYTMPAVGGSPRSLLGGKEVSGTPVWSADSRELAYVVTDSNKRYVEIVALESGESRRFELPGRTPNRIDLSGTTDGRAFAYVVGGEQEDITQLCIVRTADGEAFPITDGLYKDRSPSWSQDGRIIYFVSNRGGSTDLWQMRLKADFRPDGSPEPITTGIGMNHAVFSPDGSRLAYSKGRRVANIWRVKIPEPGAGPATWTETEQITFENAFIEFFDISADGQQLVFSSDRMGNPDIWKMTVNGDELQQLTTNPTPDWDPEFSPDGRQIAFYAYRSGNRNIWIMPASGGPAEKLTTNEGGGGLPSWSPDGKTISFVSGGGGLHIWLIPALGGDPTKLTSLFDWSYLHNWSPDGQSMVFLGARGGTNGWWILPVVGGDAKPITNIGNARDVHWAPDGKRIYFNTGEKKYESPAMFGGDLWELTLGNTQTRQLTNLSGRYGFLLRGSPSPDGKYLYFSWQEDTGDLWVMDVERDK